MRERVFVIERSMGEDKGFSPWKGKSRVGVAVLVGDGHVGDVDTGPEPTHLTR